VFGRSPVGLNLPRLLDHGDRFPFGAPGVAEPPQFPDYYRRFIDPPEIAVLKTCPKDERGCLNFSLAASGTARLSSARSS
jgi:hypothetical protein